MSDEPTKVCSHCHKEKYLWQFAARAKSKDGKQHYCKECGQLLVSSAQKKAKAGKTESGKKQIKRLDVWRMKTE